METPTHTNTHTSAEGSLHFECLIVFLCVCVCVFFLFFSPATEDPVKIDRQPAGGYDPEFGKGYCKVTA